MAVSMETTSCLRLLKGHPQPFVSVSNNLSTVASSLSGSQDGVQQDHPGVAGLRENSRVIGYMSKPGCKFVPMLTDEIHVAAL